MMSGSIIQLREHAHLSNYFETKFYLILHNSGNDVSYFESFSIWLIQRPMSNTAAFPRLQLLVSGTGSVSLLEPDKQSYSFPLS